jgi:hypothetical protein
MSASGEGAAGSGNVTRQQEYDAHAPYNQQTQQTEASVAEELGWAQGESPAGAEGGAQPNVQGADQPTAIFPRSNPEPGNADDPVGTNLIPPVSTGERRWVDAQVGALDSEGGKDWTNQVGTATGPGTPGLVSQSGGESGQGEWPPVAQDENQYTNPEYAGIQGDMMGSNPTIQGAPFEQGLPPGQDDLTPGNEGFVEGGNEGPPTEAYGQGETRQLAPLGAEPGIEQQEILQSQQYEREERRSRQGILGAVGDMLGALFGNAKRTPVPPPAGEDEGETAGEAHP